MHLFMSLPLIVGDPKYTLSSDEAVIGVGYKDDFTPVSPQHDMY